jgi:hypothetical protein
VSSEETPARAPFLINSAAGAARMRASFADAASRASSPFSAKQSKMLSIGDGAFAGARSVARRLRPDRPVQIRPRQLQSASDFHSQRTPAPEVRSRRFDFVKCQSLQAFDSSAVIHLSNGSRVKGL